ncbi:MAG: ATP-dependent helicase, partial [Thermodesulfobacteriota bacterium]|nr:ATP-dependent helicase [Thermodesulfobacteriota bacterium]
MRKSKAEKKKQKRKIKKKQVKAIRFKKAARENGWFYLEEAHYFFDIGNMDRAVKFVKKAARALPNEEEVFRVMGHIASDTGNTVLELDAMAALERIGKITDDM